MQAELVKNLKQFADVHGITTDIDKFLENLPAGDFVVLSSAIDSNDSAAIIDLLNSYNATKLESYNYFKMCYAKQNDKLMEYVNLLGNRALTEYIKAFCSAKVFNEAKYSTAMLKSIVYEDLQSSANSSLDGKIQPNQNTTDAPTEPSQDSDIDPEQLVKMKFDMLNKKLTAGQNVQTDDGELVGIDQDSGLGVVKNGDDVSVVDPEGLSVDDDDDLSWLDDAIASMDRR